MQPSRTSNNRLRQVGEDEPFDETPPTRNPESNSAVTEAATAAVFLALKALSQRAIVAVSELFTLLTAGSVCYLWLQVLPQPTMIQLESVSIYSVFILVLHLLRRR